MNTSTNLSVLAASALFKKSKATLYKHLKNGILSKNTDGTISLSELIRCYGEPSRESLTVENKEVYEGRAETELRLRVELLEKQLEESKKREEISLDRELYQRQQVTELQHALRMIEDKRGAHEQPKSLLGRLRILVG